MEEFLDNLDHSLSKAWNLLQKGADDRNSAFHLPSIATVVDKNPQQRVMVCREVDVDARLLRFHTDKRSDKVSEVGEDAPISILGYHPEEKIQLRLSGRARIEHDTPAVDKAWDEATLFSKRCYLAEPGPGTPIDAPASGLPRRLEGHQPDEQDVLPGRENFAILLATIDQIEWLFLAHTGHRRALFSWIDDAAKWNGQWLIP